jgi:hypothetical protein
MGPICAIANMSHVLNIAYFNIVILNLNQFHKTKQINKKNELSQTSKSYFKR